MKNFVFVLPGTPAPIGGFRLAYSHANMLSKKYPVEIFHVNISYNEKNFKKRFIGWFKFLKSKIFNKYKNYAKTEFSLNIKYSFFSFPYKNINTVYIVCSWQLLLSIPTNFIKKNNIMHIAMDYFPYMGDKANIYKCWKTPVNFMPISKFLDNEISTKIKSNSKKLYFPAVVNFLDQSSIKIFYENQKYKRDVIITNLTQGKYKNTENAIKLLNILSKSFNVVAYGRHNKPSNLSNNVRYLISPSDNEVEILYNTSLAVINVSEFEGFGLPLFEGMSRGALGFTTDNFGCRDFCEFGFNSILLSKTNMNKNYKIILEILNSQIRCKELLYNAKNSLINFYNKFSPNSLISLYEKL